MRKAGRQRMDLQSPRHLWSFATPSDHFCDPNRRHQILLQLGQHGIGADLRSRVAAIIVAAGECQDGDGGRESGETARQLCRTGILEGVHHDYAPTRWRFARAEATQAVKMRTATTSAES